MIKLNLGSFTVMFGHGWLNLDQDTRPDLYEYASQGKFMYMAMNLSTRLPWPDNTVDYIFSSHFLEHLPYRYGEKIVADCCRVLKPGGVMRIGVPDLSRLIAMYTEGRLSELNKINAPSRLAKYDTERFWEVLTAEHHAAYDYKTLDSLLKMSGFKEVTECKFQESNHLVFKEETRDMYPEISVYVEGTK